MDKRIEANIRLFSKYSEMDILNGIDNLISILDTVKSDVVSDVKSRAVELKNCDIPVVKKAVPLRFLENSATQILIENGIDF